MDGSSDSTELETAQNYKLAGNERFKAGDYHAAIGQYHRALLYVKSVTSERNAPFSTMMSASRPPMNPLTEEQLRDVNQLYADCQANLAACLLNVVPPCYERVVECCKDAMGRVPTHVKAHYRHGVALYHLRRYDDAIESLRKAAKLQNKMDAKTSQYISRCREGLKEQDKELRSQYQAMFSPASAANASITNS